MFGTAETDASGGGGNSGGTSGNGGDIQITGRNVLLGFRIKCYFNTRYARFSPPDPAFLIAHCQRSINLSGGTINTSGVS